MKHCNNPADLLVFFVAKNDGTSRMFLISFAHEPNTISVVKVINSRSICEFFSGFDEERQVPFYVFVITKLVGIEITVEDTTIFISVNW